MQLLPEGQSLKHKRRWDTCFCLEIDTPILCISMQVMEAELAELEAESMSADPNAATVEDWFWF